ncbi:dimethylglycine dehydrogenase, mitochondrial-like [Dorcoceras hygrometricum]|uniref:Dimethylglycine dehydrogenase, mitochondrial-like n=1 Tax=Dorcoceras hygrometricum TaxID=472368 RepID=A0A2Z7C0I9_9LAMI|nr:dimethylglycine dehydrogenase, mitochondrial-like [Dorcoceras hygrometricum]
MSSAAVLLASPACILRRSFPNTTPFPKPRLYAFRCCKSNRRRKLYLSCALPFDLSPPPIDLDPWETTIEVEPEVLDGWMTNNFDDDEALDALNNDVVVVDLSNYGRIRVSGQDRKQFLHNQTTANFECLSEGQGCDTVFVTPTARTIDLSHAWVMKNAIVLVVSPTAGGSIIDMLKKYIFPADKVEIQDITDQTRMFALLGPKSVEMMKNLNVGNLVGQPYGCHKHFNVGGMPLTVAVGSTISEEGFTLMMSPSAAGSVWKTLVGQGAVPMGANAWETLRVLRGRPAPGKELTDEYNVLEAGLWRAVSLNKGCYKGQETISRLVTYDGVKQRLWGFQLSSPVEPGNIITLDGKKVGKLTSFTAGRKGSEPFGLGYIKRRVASEGDSVTVGESAIGKLVELPFLREQPPPPPKT